MLVKSQFLTILNSTIPTQHELLDSFLTNYWNLGYYPISINPNPNPSATTTGTTIAWSDIIWAFTLRFSLSIVAAAVSPLVPTSSGHELFPTCTRVCVWSSNQTYRIGLEDVITIDCAGNIKLLLNTLAFIRGHLFLFFSVFDAQSFLLLVWRMDV